MIKTVQILEPSYSKSGYGFTKRKVFEFTGEVEKFDMKKFERTLKKHIKKMNSEFKIGCLCAWALAYGFYAKIFLSL